jgi:predicted nucleic acid-binding protein
VIVVDASAALSGLLNDGPARQTLAHQQIHVPHLVDAEIASGLRRRTATRAMSAEAAWAALDTWRRLGMTRYPTFSLLDRVWALRDNVSAHDATYVAIAELLGCALLTADSRLARAPGLRCPVTIVPR